MCNDVKMKNDAVSIKFHVSEACNGCGMCSMQYPNYFFETDEGKAQAKDGTVKVEDSVAAEIEGLCPVHVITVEKESKSTKQLLAEKLEKMKECRVAYPAKETIPFKKEEYCIPIPFASGAYRYDYSSESAANRAARSEFNSKMYSQIDVLILKVITEYRVKYIKPYYSKNAEDNSVYYDCNKKTEKTLADIARILEQDGLGSDIPADFCVVDCYPEKDITWKMLNKGELLSDEMISSIRSEFDSGSYSSLDSYETYWDTDDMEVFAGTGFGGKMKYKTKYCYRSLNEAFEELAKDLMNACSYKEDRIVDRAFEMVEWLIGEYHKKLDQLLQEKVMYIEKKIQTL